MWVADITYIPNGRGLPLPGRGDGLVESLRPRLARDSGPNINFELLVQAREATGREPSPTGGVIDGQSVKTTESGRPLGYDVAKKVKRRKASHSERYFRSAGRRRGAPNFPRSR